MCYKPVNAPVRHSEYVVKMCAFTLDSEAHLTIKQLYFVIGGTKQGAVLWPKELLVRSHISQSSS